MEERMNIVDYDKLSDAVAWGILKAMVGMAVIGFGIALFLGGFMGFMGP